MSEDLNDKLCHDKVLLENQLLLFKLKLSEISLKYDKVTLEKDKLIKQAKKSLIKIKIKDEIISALLLFLNNLESNKNLKFIPSLKEIIVNYNKLSLKEKENVFKQV